jgi:hypothetical protein
MNAEMLPVYVIHVRIKGEVHSVHLDLEKNSCECDSSESIGMFQKKKSDDNWDHWKPIEINQHSQCTQ